MTHRIPSSLVLATLGIFTLVASLYFNGPPAPALPVVSRVPEFSFVTEAHAPFTRSGFEGKVTIADFIFTSCAGTCPMMSTKMASLQEELAPDKRIQFVSTSVDPVTDTPEALSTYGKGYGARPGRWIFLTGDKKEIFSLVRDGFHLGLDTEGDDAIIHSQKFVLVDAEANIRGYYDSEEEQEMHRLVRDARALAREIGR
jgi:protein SCO1/2